MASNDGEEAAAGNINPLLLASARNGSSEVLGLLFQLEDRQNPQLLIPTDEFCRYLRGIRMPDPPDAELGVDHQQASLAAGALLKGVTPDGDTALHAVAGKGDGPDFLKCADRICARDWDLLFAKNHNGDTPLHCAARAGNTEMVSRLIALAGLGAGGERPNWKIKLLRMENKRHETALHEAIRIENGRILGPKDREALFQADRATDEKIKNFVEQQTGMTIVKQLMGADPQLANYPANGISPLYFAIFLDKDSIALTLYQESGGNLSYSGADGQNALHLALLRDKDKVMVELLLDWNKDLTMQVDKDGSTPLHFSSSIFYWTYLFLRIQLLPRPPWCFFHWFPWIYSWTLEKVYKANPAALYQADKNGFFPIHVAASVGGKGNIQFFLRECRDSAGLRDATGKTFLHVAIEKRRFDIVSYACRNPTLPWILNMQDSDGNTALHLAIKAGSFRMFCALFGNPKVNLNLTNNKGETPRDLSRSKLPSGMYYVQNSENRIYHALWSVRANHSGLRGDTAEEKYSRRTNPEEEEKESEKLKAITQSFMVASVLIATMAFTATFAIPGGYRADDHTNGGTPTLAGGYIFDAFMMATTLAFIVSLLATVGFMYAGIPMINLSTRKIYLGTSVLLMTGSVVCMSIAFALGVYMMLAPVAWNTAVAICVVTPLAFVAREMESLIKSAILVRPLVIRKGLFLGVVQLLYWNIFRMATTLWPFVVIFGWGGLARIHHGR